MTSVSVTSFPGATVEALSTLIMNREVNPTSTELIVGTSNTRDEHETDISMI